MSTEAQELAEAVTSWLVYKNLTGLRSLVTEASMGVPIAEYLSTKYEKEVESEKNHPAFDQGSRGRPKQIDFVRVKRNDQSWHAAYECKFKNPSMDRVIEDVCRLACLANLPNFHTPARYFIYAGLAGNDGLLFRNTFNTGAGGRIGCFEGILGQGKDDLGTENSFKLTELHEKQLRVFRDFAKGHDVCLPSKIVAKLVGWSAENERFGCAVWQIKSAKGSKLLNRRDLVKN